MVFLFLCCWLSINILVYVAIKLFFKDVDFEKYSDKKSKEQK